MTRLSSFGRPVRFYLCLAALPIYAQTLYGPDTPEEGSVEAIARFVTDPLFTNPWVACVPASATVISPPRYLKHIVGAPGELSCG